MTIHFFNYAEPANLKIVSLTPKFSTREFFVSVLSATASSKTVMTVAEVVCGLGGQAYVFHIWRLASLVKR